MSIKLPPENIYGHTKKLAFIREECRRFAQVSGRSLGELDLLDFGCGNGSAVSQYLIELGCRFTGVDVHGDSLEYARNHYALQSAEFVEPSALTGRRFDIIVYADVLEHLINPLKLLRLHVKELLKEGGMVIGSVPNGYGPFEMEKRLDKAFNLTPVLTSLFALRRKILGKPLPHEQIPYNHDSGHVQFYTKKAFTSLLQSAGLSLRYFGNGAFLGAPFSEQTILRGTGIARWNAKIADYLPHWAVSSWLFSAQAA